MKLAIFDFDGTIISKDSMIEFLFFTHGRVKAIFNLILLSPVLFLYLIRVIPNWKAKEFVLTRFYKGMSIDDFNRLSSKFSKEIIPKMIRPLAMEKIEWHKSQGHKVVIVSASIENYLIHWCCKQKIDLLATRLEIRDNRMTGRLSTKNCHGAEKVKRIQLEHDISNMQYIYAYGDSRSDRKLATIAHDFHYKPFC